LAPYFAVGYFEHAGIFFEAMIASSVKVFLFFLRKTPVYFGKVSFQSAIKE
jgi:hypothetical protein